MDKNPLLEEIERRKKLFGHYYDNFEKHLSDNKISKASEFLWGALNCLIYSIGLTYNLKLSSHGQIIEFCKRISSDENEPSIFGAIKIGEELHANFYHDFLDKEGLELKRKEIDKLISNLGSLLDRRIKSIKENFVEDTPSEEIISDEKICGQ